MLQLPGKILLIIVASKAWGPFDFTLGLGWGYLGTSGN
ncbi:YjbH domain-containing protein, partial [Escherichia sp. SP-MK2]